MNNLNKRIFEFELNGKNVLGFDTGLDARSFAQAKMAAFLTQPGFIVRPDGAIETWRSGGVAERETMTVWGPLFRGESLSSLLDAPGREDEALDAIRLWLRARARIERASTGRASAERASAGQAPTENAPDNSRAPVFPGPAGAFIITGKTAPAPSEGADTYPEGTVFFPPERLVKRGLDTAGETGAGGNAAIDAERCVHPGLEGDEGISFSAGVMLYRVFSGAYPFPGDDLDEVRQNIREGNFIPPELAAPGLSPEMASFITRALFSGAPGLTPKINAARQRPAPDDMAAFIGAPGSRPVSFWVKPLDARETAKISAEREQYHKKKNMAVKSRRFVIRNAAVIAGAAIAVVAALIFVREIVRARSEQPSTLGMAPLEVAAAYYGAFNALDHSLMGACVTDGAGKDDVNTVANLFVVSKVRQAYEGADTWISAAEWLESGSPPTDKTVFGITDLKIHARSEDKENARLEAEYVLWAPGADSPGENPQGLARNDTLSLVFQKDRWRIAGIARREAALPDGR